MKPNIWIRQMKWAMRYGLYLGTRRERSRIEWEVEQLVEGYETEIIAEVKEQLFAIIKGVQK